MKFTSDREYRFCTFYLNGDRYAVDILAVREITRHLQVTPARGSASCVLGLLNLRGQVVTVISPAVLLSIPEQEDDATACLMVLKTNQELEQRSVTDYETSEDLMGLWCEKVSDVISVYGREIKTPPASAEGVVNPETLDGVIEGEEDLVRILDPGRLLEAGAATL
jgi:purine-binding chemotaxis protein CheW